MESGEIQVSSVVAGCSKAHFGTVGKCVYCERDEALARVSQLQTSLKRYTDWFECMAASMEKLSEQERRKS